jgi:heme-degrading monooxygenase HmoA
MIAVIFEFTPVEGRFADYRALAEGLADDVRSADGFLSIERFESLPQPGKLLSLSFWRDEAAVAEWRQVEAHRAAQTRGRGGVFADYRLRVAEVLRDYGMDARDQAPADSRAAHDQAG